MNVSTPTTQPTVHTTTAPIVLPASVTNDIQHTLDVFDDIGLIDELSIDDMLDAMFN